MAEDHTMLITVITNQGGVHVCTSVQEFGICGKAWLRLITTNGDVVDINPSYIVEMKHMAMPLPQARFSQVKGEAN